MLCTYPSLSDYYENWEKLACDTEERKFLLPTNWELIQDLLGEYKYQGKIEEVPEKNPLSLESGYFQAWKTKLKESLMELLEIDYQELLDKYIEQVFNDQYSKLNYKIIHPEEIKNKHKLYPTLSGARNIYSYLNRKLEILPLFYGKREPEGLELFQGWPLEQLDHQRRHKFSSEWISELEKGVPELFKFREFKEPKLPTNKK